MSKIITTVVVLIGALIFGAAILGTVSSIKSDFIDPNADIANAALQSTGTQTITIEGDNSEATRNQMKGLIVFNMLAASDCRLLSSVSSATNDDSHPSIGSLEELRSNSNAIYTKSWFEAGFEPLFADTSFQGVCAGASSVIFRARDAVGDAAIPIQNGHLIPGTGNSDAAREPGNDMEGKFGRVNFKINKTFSMGDPVGQYRGRIIGIKALPQVPEEEGGSGHDLPGFWLGKRAAVLLPEGITGFTDALSCTEKKDMMVVLPEESNKAWACEDGVLSYGSGEENMYAFRIKTVNVPIIHRNPLELMPNTGRGGIFRPSEDSYGRYGLRDFLDSAEYVFCKDSVGHIQSNAGSIDNEGEAAAETPTDEDVVFPKIKLAENGCSIRGVADAKLTGNIISQELSRGMRSSAEQCSISVEAANSGKEAKEIGQIEMGLVNGDMESVQGYCGLRSQKMEFSEFDNSDYTGEINYLTPAYYASCTSESKDYEITPFYYSKSSRNAGSVVFTGDESYNEDRPLLLSGASETEGEVRYGSCVNNTNAKKREDGFSAGNCDNTDSDDRCAAQSAINRRYQEGMEGYSSSTDIWYGYSRDELREFMDAENGGSEYWSGLRTDTMSGSNEYYGCNYGSDSSTSQNVESGGASIRYDLRRYSSDSMVEVKLDVESVGTWFGVSIGGVIGEGNVKASSSSGELRFDDPNGESETTDFNVEPGIYTVKIWNNKVELSPEGSSKEVEADINGMPNSIVISGRSGGTQALDMTVESIVVHDAKPGRCS